MKITRLWFLAAFVSLLAACGGGSGSATTPTAIYGGAASSGDVFTFEMDVPSTAHITWKNATTGESGVVSYTNTDNLYTLTDDEGETFHAWLIPNSVAVVRTPSSDVDIVLAVAVDTTRTDLSFAKGNNYSGMQFRHDNTGVAYMIMAMGADGLVTGASNEDITAAPNPADFPADIDLDNFIYDSTYSYFTFSYTDPDGASQTDTYFLTPEGHGVVDLGPDRGMIFLQEQSASTEIPDGIGVGDVFNMMVYHRESESGTGFEEVNEGTVTVTAIPAADQITVDVDIGGEAESGLNVVPVGDNWPGFFYVVGRNIVVRFVSSEAFIFSQAEGEWKYSYGLGVK